MKEKKWKLRGRQIISARGAKKKKIKEDTQGGRSVQPLLRIERGVVPRVGPHVRAHAAHIHPFPPPHTHMCACMRTTTLYACVATAPAATATAPARVSYHATPCMPTAAAPPLETWSLGGGGSHMSVRLSSKKNQL